MFRLFYLGIYKKGDKFQTQRELKENYNVAMNSVKKVFKALQEKGFIRSEGYFGTTVLFDMDDKEQVSKVPFYCHYISRNRSNILKVPISLIASIISNAIYNSQIEELQDCLLDIDVMIQSIDVMSYSDKLFGKLFMKITKILDNRYLYDIVENFTENYIYFDTTTKVRAEEEKEINDYVLIFLKNLKEDIVDNKCKDIEKIIFDYYEKICFMPNALIFSLEDRNTDIFKKESLYGELIHKVILEIITKKMKKGDKLPNEKERIKECDVSIATVRKANSVLEEVGLIRRIPGIGTKLIVDIDDRKLKIKLNNMILEREKSLESAMQTMLIMGKVVAAEIKDDNMVYIIEEIKEKTEVQWNAFENYNIPLFVTDALITPIINAIGVGIINKYYVYPYNELVKFVTICGMQTNSDFTRSNEVYDYMCKATKELKKGNLFEFSENIQKAQMINGKMLQDLWG